jgi:sugar phosphate permease
MNLAYLSGFGANFIRWGVLSWMVMILAEPIENGGFGLSLIAAGWITSLASLGGAFFSILLGVITDRIFKGSRWQTIMGGFLIGSVPLLYLSKGGVIMENQFGVFFIGLSMFISGGLIQAVQSPLFDLPGDILGRAASGTGVGIMDGWMYVGASFAGVFLGWWLDQFGYASGIQLMGIVGIVSGFLAILIRK